MILGSYLPYFHGGVVISSYISMILTFSLDSLWCKMQYIVDYRGTWSVTRCSCLGFQVYNHLYKLLWSMPVYFVSHGCGCYIFVWQRVNTGKTALGSAVWLAIISSKTGAVDLIIVSRLFGSICIRLTTILESTCFNGSKNSLVRILDSSAHFYLLPSHLYYLIYLPELCEPCYSLLALRLAVCSLIGCDLQTCVQSLTGWLSVICIKYCVILMLEWWWSVGCTARPQESLCSVASDLERIVHLLAAVKKLSLRRTFASLCDTMMGEHYLNWVRSLWIYSVGLVTFFLRDLNFVRMLLVSELRLPGHTRMIIGGLPRSRIDLYSHLHRSTHY